MYYDLLDGVRTKGDWETWIDFFLDGVEEEVDPRLNGRTVDHCACCF